MERKVTVAKKQKTATVYKEEEDKEEMKRERGRRSEGNSVVGSLGWREAELVAFQR